MYRTSLILYCCSCFWTNKSSLLRRLFRQLYLCANLLLPLKKKVFTSSFFLYLPSPWNWSRKREAHSKQKKLQYLHKNRMFFKGYIKICKTAVITRATPGWSLVLYKIRRFVWITIQCTIYNSEFSFLLWFFWGATRTRKFGDFTPNAPE